MGCKVLIFNIVLSQIIKLKIIYYEKKKFEKLTVKQKSYL